VFLMPFQYPLLVYGIRNSDGSGLQWTGAIMEAQIYTGGAIE